MIQITYWIDKVLKAHKKEHRSSVNTSFHNYHRDDPGAEMAYNPYFLVAKTLKIFVFTIYVITVIQNRKYINLVFG